MTTPYLPIIQPLTKESKKPIYMKSLQQIPISFATCSIGFKPADTLPRKLEAIAKAGFNAVELSFPDILMYGARTRGRDIDPQDFDELNIVAKEIKRLCETSGLGIMMLQPFGNFEGWPRGSPERADAFRRARGWIEVMSIVNTDMLQVSLPSPAPAN